MPVHDRYGGPLPQIKTVRLEENVSEKIARLNRTTTARDMYDLAWICSQGRLWSELDKDLIRRLAVLKIWTDSNGMHAGNTAWARRTQGLRSIREGGFARATPGSSTWRTSARSRCRLPGRRCSPSA